MSGSRNGTCRQIINGALSEVGRGAFGSADGAVVCDAYRSGDYAPCCQPGTRCLPDNFCAFDGPLEGASGYYVAGCTDPLYRDPKVCSDRCVTDLPVKDVVFNAQSNLWACCNGTNEARTCATPSDETFRADSPRALSAAVSALTASGTLSATTAGGPTTTAGTTSAVSSAASAPAANTGSGLSTGASVGVGVGVGLGVGGLALLGLIGFFIMRRRKRREAADGAEVERPGDGVGIDRSHSRI